MKVFVPFSEALVESYGCSLGELVPYQLEYQCFPVETVSAGDWQGQDSGGNRKVDEDATYIGN
jgi:hypothetical protein